MASTAFSLAATTERSGRQLQETRRWIPCPLCDDTGWKPVEEAASNGGSRGVRRVVRCDCWRRTLSEKRLADANIPKRYQHCTIDKLRAYNDSLQEAVDSAARFVESYPVVERGLLFLGHAG